MRRRQRIHEGRGAGGRIERRVYIVAYTMRGEASRLISARKANRREQRRYYERHQLDPKKPRELTPEEERRLAKTLINYSDIPPLGDEFFSQAKRAWPPSKQHVTLRLDTDVLAWL